jgi:hypothetical protein
MTENSKIVALEKELNEKIEVLEKLKKSWPKIVAFLLIATFTLPFIPFRRGTLESQYGYWGGVLFSACICFLLTSIIASYTLDKMQKEIYDLERNLELEKRRNDVQKK